MIIDFRCRVPTPEFSRVYEALGNAFFSGLGYRRPSSMTMDEYFKILDDAGISKVVSLGRDAETKDGMKVPLEHVAEIQNKYPDRVIGFGGIDCLKGPKAVADVQKAADLGLKGTMIDTMRSGIFANDKRLYPIYAKCQELKLPIVLTCAGFNDPRWSAVMPVADVVADFPELKVIVSHTWPHVIDAIYLSVYFKNFYFEMSGFFNWPGCEQLIGGLNRLMSDHMLFASAWPYSPDVKKVVERFKQFYDKLRPEVMEKVLHGNAESLLGLKGESASA